MTADVPLLVVHGHNLLFRACVGTPAQILSRNAIGKRDLTTQFMFFGLLRKGINDKFGHWPEVMVVFDGQDGATRRRDTDPGYKATRPEDPEALRPCRHVHSAVQMEAVSPDRRSPSRWRSTWRCAWESRARRMGPVSWTRSRMASRTGYPDH